MKERYYTLDNIDSKANLFAEKCKAFQKNRQIKLSKQDVALLVMDMQNYFSCEDSHAFIPSIKAIIPKIKKLQDYFLNNDLCVIQTKHGNTSESAFNMNKWWSDTLKEGTESANIIDELLDERALVVCKSQYDAFWQTDLENMLKKRNIKQVVITGVMTHLCCETTARSAFVRGFEVFFAIDGTATYNQTLHLSSLVNLSHGFSVPCFVEDIVVG